MVTKTIEDKYKNIVKIENNKLSITLCFKNKNNTFSSKTCRDKTKKFRTSEILLAIKIALEKNEFSPLLVLIINIYIYIKLYVVTSVSIKNMKLFGTLSSLPEPLCSQSTSD
jgi:hypothetical protein